MAKKKIKLKKGSKINELSINSPEYRQLYESGTLASIDEEGVPNMYYPEVNVVGDAPLKLRKKRQLAKADYTDEELERYMYQGKRPDRDKDFLLPPGERLKIYNAVLPFEYPDKELPKALRRYITGEERKFLGQESIKEEDRDLGRTDEDAWAHFMGLPQLYNTVDKSEYLPTDSKSKNAEYYTIRKGYPDFDELLLENAHNWFQRKENTNANTLRGVGSPFMPLENVTYSKGQDERGKYYSMYDVYDFNVPYQKGIGKPYEVYDRVYYDDTNPDKPVVLKKSYGGKITNMKKKKSNNLPKYYNGTPGLGTPGTQGSLFNMLSGLQQLGNTQNPTLGNQNPNFKQMDNQNLSNMNVTGKGMSDALQGATGPLAGVMKMLNGPLAPLAGMAMSSVTDMVHAINTPERERRPTLQNASSYTFDNGGTVKGKKKKIKVNKKEYDVNSPEYRKLYEQGLMSVDADGLPVNYQGSDEAWNEYYESKRKKKGENAVREGRAKFVKETAKLLPANPNETDSVVENVLEYVPLLGQVLSIDDAMLAAQDMYNGNKQGTFNNALDMIGVLPFGKAGNMLRIPSYIENAADAAGIYGVGSDIYQDNISPMLYPKTNNKSIPQNTNFATSEDEYGTGGTIHIKPSKKGTFTKAAKKHGKSVQAFASQVLANKDNYSSAMVKKANFARNAAKWKKAVGGVVRPEEGYTLMPNDEMQFANMPAAFDYANGGLTGTYMDAFDAMAYGGTIDPSMYMQQMMYGSYATGGEITDPTNPINPIPVSNPYDAALKEYEDNLYLYNTKQELINALKDKSLSQAQITDLQQKNLGMGKYKDNPVYKNKKNIKNQWIDDVDQTRFHSLRVYDWAKPELRVPEIPTDEVENIMSRLSTNGNVSEYQMPDPGPMPKEDSPYKTMKDIGYSPEDINILGKIKGKGLRRSGMWLNLTDADKIAAYKRGSKFEDMPEKDVRGPGYYAMGGQVPQNIPVEVEGEEMYEMPNGQVGEFSGPKHENGGMPMALPEGTKIYSDRLKVNGKTMAARKDKREANIAKLEKLLTKNPNDKFIKEALKRQQETNALQEQGDMQQQEMANEQQAQEEMAMEEMLMGAAQQDMQEGMMMAMGGMIKRADGSYSKRGLWDNIRANKGSGKKPTKEMLKQEKKIRAAQKAYGGMVEYADGGRIPTMLGNLAGTVTGIHNLNRLTDPIKKAFTTPEPITTPYDAMTNLLTGAMQNPEQLLGNPLVDYNSAMPDYINTKKGVINLKDTPTGFVNPMFTSPSADANVAVEPGSGKGNRFMNFLNNAVDKTGDFFSGLFDRSGNPKRGTNTNSDYDLTEGDKTGMLGTSIGMYGPALMTMLNKMQTPPNTNFYSTFGQEALRTQEEAEGLAGISKDEAYRKNLMRANALRKQLANSARGVGDIRSGQLAAELAEQEGARGILTNYLQGMSQLKGQRAGLQQQIDQTRMGGEYQRDLADRQDVDQYYTNLAENVANASNMMQKQGRDLNVVQYNKDIMNLSKAYSKYGIYAVRDPKSGLLTLAHKDADGKITYLSEEEAEELAKQQSEKQPEVTTTKVEEPKKDK